jgi:hypothetical protein
MEGDKDGHGLRVTTWFTAGILQLLMQIPGRQEKARLSRNVPESHYAFMSGWHQGGGFLAGLGAKIVIAGLV